MERIKAYIMGKRFTKEQMDEMEQLLSNFFAANNIVLEPPVDVFAIATKLGFDVRGAEFEGQLEGLILVNEYTTQIEQFNSNKVIAYNCKKNIDDKKFIVGHELAHYIEEKSQKCQEAVILAAREHEGEYSNDINEQRKDYLAAAILMPRDDLLKQYSKDNIEKTHDFYSEVASKYKVSVTMATRRIEEVFYAG